MTLEHFKRKVPHPLRITTLVFLFRGDEVLLAMKKRDFGEGHYNGAGGKVEDGDKTIEDAAIREAQEEIIVTPTCLVKVAILNFYFLEVPVEENWNQQVHVFVTTKWTGKPTETEEMRPQWFNKNKLPLGRMWDGDKIWIPRVLNGEKLDADFAFDQDQQVAEYAFRHFSG